MVEEEWDRPCDRGNGDSKKWNQLRRSGKTARNRIEEIVVMTRRRRMRPGVKGPVSAMGSDFGDVWGPN